MGDLNPRKKARWYQRLVQLDHGREPIGSRVCPNFKLRGDDNLYRAGCSFVVCNYERLIYVINSVVVRNHVTYVQQATPHQIQRRLRFPDAVEA